MKSFKEYLTEENIFVWFFGTIKRALSRIRESIKKVFAILGFGDQQEIELNFEVPLYEKEELNKDSKSRLGYYFERCVSVDLAKEIQSKKLPLRNNIKDLILEKKTYKKDKIVKIFKDDESVAQEIERMEQSSPPVAKRIFEDIDINSKDLVFCEFEIILTGESEKFKSKADLRLVIIKKGTKKVLDEINASLKAYKSKNINMSNATFISWIKGVLAPEIDAVGQTFIELFLQKHGKNFERKYSARFKEVKKAADEYTRIKKREKAKGNPDYASVATKHMNKNKYYEFIRDFMVDVFNDLYKGKNISVINQNFLKQLGLDEADDIYIAIKTSKGVEVVSTKSSDEFKKLYEKLKEGFRIKIETRPGVTTTRIKFVSGKQEILSYDLAFKEEGKAISFVNLFKIVGL